MREDLLQGGRFRTAGLGNLPPADGTGSEAVDAWAELLAGAPVEVAPEAAAALQPGVDPATAEAVLHDQVGARLPSIIVPGWSGVMPREGIRLDERDLVVAANLFRLRRLRVPMRMRTTPKRDWAPGDAGRWAWQHCNLGREDLSLLLDWFLEHADWIPAGGDGPGTRAFLEALLTTGWGFRSGGWKTVRAWLTRAPDTAVSGAASAYFTHGEIKSAQAARLLKALSRRDVALETTPARGAFDLEGEVLQHLLGLLDAGQVEIDERILACLKILGETEAHAGLDALISWERALGLVTDLAGCKWPEVRHDSRLFVRAMRAAWSVGVGDVVAERCRTRVGKGVFDIAGDLDMAAALDPDVSARAGVYRRHALAATVEVEADLLTLPVSGVSLAHFLERLEIESNASPEVALIEECLCEGVHPRRSETERIGRAVAAGRSEVTSRLISAACSKDSRYLVADIIEHAPASRPLTDMVIEILVRAESLDAASPLLGAAFLRCEKRREKLFAGLLQDAARYHPSLPREIAERIMSLVHEIRTYMRTQAVYLLDGSGGRPRRLARKAWRDICEGNGALVDQAGKTIWIAEASGTGRRAGYPDQIDQVHVFEVGFDAEGFPREYCQPEHWVYPGRVSTLRAADAEALIDALRLDLRECEPVWERVETPSDHASERLVAWSLAGMFDGLGRA